MLTIVFVGRDDVEESWRSGKNEGGCLYALVVSNPTCVVCFRSELERLTCPTCAAR